MGTCMLIVDDRETIRPFLARHLQQMGYMVTQAGDVAQAMALVRDSAPDVVITDTVMPGELCELALLRSLRRSDPDLPIIVLAKQESLDVFVQATQKRLLFDCPLTPLPDLAMLETAVRRALELRHLASESSGWTTWLI